MNFKKELKQIRIDVITDTVFIQNRYFNFSYTPADNIVKDEYKGKYRYFGGLQSEYDSDSEQYSIIELQLCKIAESILDTLGRK